MLERQNVNCAISGNGPVAVRGLGAKNDADGGRSTLASGDRTCIAPTVLGLEFGAYPALAGCVNV